MKRRFVLKSGAAFGAGLLFLPSARAQSGVLNIYSARHYNTDEALYGNFADLSGVTPDPAVGLVLHVGDLTSGISYDLRGIPQVVLSLDYSSGSTGDVITITASLRDAYGAWTAFDGNAFSLTATAGAALCDASKGYVTAAQAAAIAQAAAAATASMG